MSVYIESATSHYTVDGDGDENLNMYVVVIVGSLPLNTRFHLGESGPRLALRVTHIMTPHDYVSQEDVQEHPSYDISIM